MKKAIRVSLVVAVLILALLFAVSCNKNNNDQGNTVLKENHSVELYGEYPVRLENQTVVYDGQPHALEISGELPEGVTVSYSGNDATEIGTHFVTAIFKEGDKTLPNATLCAVLTIQPKTYDMSGVSFADKTVPYDGNKHTLAIEGTLPAGVTVSYYHNDGYSEIGSYLVTALFHSEDKTYDVIPSMTARLTVAKASYDVTGVTFDNGSFVYDGQAKSLAVSGKLPAGVTVSYENNRPINAGNYTVTAHFSGDSEHYEAIPDMTAQVTIAKANYDMSAVDFGSQSFTYDGTAKNLVVSDNLPDVVSVRYEGNGKTQVGSYEVKAIFSTSNANYEAPAPMTAMMTITEAKTIAVTFRQEGRADVVRNLPVGSGLAAADIPAYAIPAPGYKTYWTFENGELATFVAFREDMTLVAKTEKIVYTITYAANADEIPADAPLTYTVTDLPIVLPTVPSRVSALAWYTDEEKTKALLTVTEIGNYTLYLGSKDATEGLIYQFNGTTSEVIGYNGVSTTVFVPASYAGTTVTGIANRAFAGRTDITFVSLGKNISSIGIGAFDGCTALDEVVLPNGLQLIGENAFRSTALTNVTLPDGLVAIGAGAYENVALTSIKMPFIGGSQNTSKGYLAYIFGGYSFGANRTKVPASLKTVILSGACTSIPANAFDGCSSIEKIVVGDSVKFIGANAFRGTSIREIYLPKSCTNVFEGTLAASPFTNGGAGITIVTNAEEEDVASSIYEIIAGVSRAEYDALGAEGLKERK